MKITILTYGSSGDVLPYISLALGLNDAGYQVSLAAPSNFEVTVKGYGLNYYPIFGDVQQILGSDDGRQWMAAGNTRSFAKALALIFYKQRFEMQRDVLTACQGADAIIAGSMMPYYAAMVSEKLGLPMLIANVNPVQVLTGDFPHFLVRAKPFFLRVLNKLSYVKMSIAYEKSMKPMMNAWRVEIGLPALKGSVFLRMVDLKMPVILGYSPVLLPRPAEWGAHVAVTGIWKMDARYNKPTAPDVALIAWLQNGPAPIYFGFGSMPVSDPHGMINLVKDICRETGKRAIINAGWTNVQIEAGALNDAVFMINYADLEWLFSQCSSVVHHGGVGTTHICLASGIPPLICSVFADNAFWGERLAKLNAGRHIPYKDISKEKIIRAIAELDQEATKAQARAIGVQIKTGEGLKNAVDFINQKLPEAKAYVDWKSESFKFFKDIGRALRRFNNYPAIEK